MGSKGHFIMGALFALLGIARFLTDGSALFGWIYVGLGAVWCALGWRMKRREAAAEDTGRRGADVISDETAEAAGKREHHNPTPPSA